MDQLEVYREMFNASFSDVPIDSIYRGVIVEPRRHPHLELVLRNFIFMMRDWSLIIYHSDHNREYVEGILGENHNVRLIRWIEDEGSIDEYNRLLMSKFFYEEVGGERILIFQTDSFIRRRDIDRFIHYDYVGAPWSPGSLCDNDLLLRVHNGTDITEVKVGVGNGGLSLRNPKVMIDIIGMKEINHLKGNVNEDIFFSIGIYLHPTASRCPYEVAATFSVETVFYHNPFGWHKAYRYWNGPQWDILKSISLA